MQRHHAGLDSADASLPALIAKIEGLRDQDLVRGVMGLRLLTAVFDRHTVMRKVGSFLEMQFTTNMQHRVENWRKRCESGDIGLGQWIRRAIPSAQLTYRRRNPLN